MRLKPGDCFEVPLPDGKRGYGQYLLHDRGKGKRPGQGTLVRIFDIISETEVPLERLARAGELFPPVFVTLDAALKTGGWRIVGRLPVGDFKFPKFRSLRSHGWEPGKHHDWVIWDEDGPRYVGDLTPEYRDLEVFALHGHRLIEKRISGQPWWFDGMS